MPQYAGSARTICPFYMRETSECITCEGFHRRMTLRMDFETEESKAGWQREKCNTFSYMESCPLARELSGQYRWED